MSSFFPGQDATYLRELRAALQAHGVRVPGSAVDMGDIANPDEAAHTHVLQPRDAEVVTLCDLAEDRYRELAGGVFNLTMHPQVIGRGHRMLLLERLIAYFRGHDGIRFATLATVAEEFRAHHRPGAA